MSKFCISFSLATRLIGAFGLTISILMINILASDFLSTTEHDEFSATVESWAFFGLNWTFLVRNSQNFKQAELFLICVLLYVVCSLVANALLSFASITRKPKLTLPWMYVQVINIIDQSIAIAVHLYCTGFNAYEKTAWYIPVSSIYLLLNACFLIVVCAARKEWDNFPRRDICISTIMRSYEDTQGSNLPKSPSYLADQSSFMNSPKPMVPSKYDQV